MEQTSINFYSWANRYKRLILLALTLHLITAWFSTGFLHPDEHFQNFEFMMGRWWGLGTDHLPWEFAAKMRPWLLPSVISLSKFILHIEIFSLETFWRFANTLFGFFSLLYFIKSSRLRRHHERFAMWLTCAFFWFLPFIHSRVSGENIGTSLFILGLIPLLSQNEQKGVAKAILGGVLIGLGIQLRYHLGFMLIGLFIFKHKQIKPLALCLIGIIIATAIGAVLDTLGYQTFSLTPWNYLSENIVHNRAAFYGVSPWYWYMTRIHTMLYPPISIFIVTSFLWQWITRPKTLITAMTLPFFLIHCLVGHKEMRFLVPLIPFAVIVGGSYYGWLLKNFKLFTPKNWRGFIKLILVLSVLLSFVSGIKPASNDYAFLEKWGEIEATSAPETVYYLGAESAFNMYQLEARSLIKNAPRNERIPNQDSFKDFVATLSPGTTLSVIASSPGDQKWIEREYPACHRIFIASNIAAFLKSKRNPALYRCEVEL